MIINMKRFVLMKLDKKNWSWIIVENFDEQPTEQDVYHYADNANGVQYRVFENIAGFKTGIKLDKIDDEAPALQI